MFLEFSFLKKFLQFIMINIFLYLFASSCNYNPLGSKSSHIDEGNKPFLQLPINYIAPSLSGLPASGIVQSAGTVLTGNIGSWWNEIINCSYQWYVNNVLISGATSLNYTTQASDVCKIITFNATCRNSVGSSSVMSNYNWSDVLSSYASRVRSVSGNTLTITGQTQIQSFLNNFIVNKLPLPDYMYAMRNYQNAGTGLTLFDLYCNAHNTTLNASSTWNTTGITISSTTPIATVTNVFDGTKNSTIVAVTHDPGPTLTSWRGVAAYSSVSGGGTGGFGYASTAGRIHLQFIGGTIPATLTAGIYDFWGLSENGLQINWSFNNQYTNTTSSGKRGDGDLIIGDYTNTGISLRDFMSYISAWNTQALNLNQMNTIRQSYSSTLGTGLSFQP